MTLGKNIKKQTLIPDQEDIGAKVAEKEMTKSISKGQKAKTKRKKDQAVRTEVRKKFEEELADLKTRQLNIITMRLGNGQYGFEIDRVQEVVVTPEIVQIPHTPDFVKGVGNVRGQSIMILDLEKKFHLETMEQQADSYSIIVESDNFIVGIVTNEMPTTQKVDGINLESIEGNYAEDSLDESYVKGLIKVKDNIVFLVDVNALIESDAISSIVRSI